MHDGKFAISDNRFGIFVLTVGCLTSAAEHNVLSPRVVVEFGTMLSLVPSERREMKVHEFERVEILALDFTFSRPCPNQEPASCARLVEELCSLQCVDQEKLPFRFTLVDERTHGLRSFAVLPSPRGLSPVLDWLSAEHETGNTNKSIQSRAVIIRPILPANHSILRDQLEKCQLQWNSSAIEIEQMSKQTTTFSKSFRFYGTPSLFAQIDDVGESIDSSLHEEDPSRDGSMDEWGISLLETLYQTKTMVESGIMSQQIVAGVVDAALKTGEQVLGDAVIQGISGPLTSILDSILAPVLNTLFFPPETIGLMDEPQNVPLADSIRFMQTKGSSKGISITGKLKKILATELTNSIAADIAEVANRVHVTLQSSLVDQINRTLSRSLSQILTVTLTRSLSHSLVSSIVAKISRSQADIPVRQISKAMIPALTNSLALIIGHSLSRSPKSDYFCHFCASDALYCQECEASKQSDYEQGFVASYYSRYYGSYYSAAYSYGPQADSVLEKQATSP